MVGFSLAVYGISTVVVQGFLIRLILPRLDEWRTLAWFLPYNAAILLVIAVIPHGWLLLLVTPLCALGALVQPAIQGRASRIADDDQQGELQGVLASLTGIAAIVSPLLMTRMFNLATEGGRNFPDAPFLLAAILMTATWAVFRWQAGRTAQR